MKKFFSILLLLVLSLSLFPLSACGEEEIIELNVYNWEDYIACEDFDMVAEFESWYEEEYGKKIVVNYSTFGTNENMYNELKLTQKKDGTYSYDLVCPSEYMIQKMIQEGMLETYDYTKLPNYEQNVAPYISQLFLANGWYDYATCFNWGTMGFTYNPDKVDFDDVSSWAVVNNHEYENKITIKDSVRDSYVLALGYIHADKLMALQSTYADNLLSKEYNAEVHKLLNDFSEESIEKARLFLTEARQNLYGFEVDSGKQDMATGKLLINFAWSGDAVYAMDFAEEQETYLEYVVPKEGSNIFFDGWVMPKGANKELAQLFLNFMYEESNAIENLDYICYSSPMVGEDVFSYVCENYGLTTLVECSPVSDEEVEELGLYVTKDGKYYEEIYIGYADDFDGQSTYTATYYDESTNSVYQEDVDVFPHDVKHFFGDKIAGDGIIYTDSLNRQLVAMYPTEETMNRCVVMEHIESKQLKLLNNMWDSVKVGYMPYSTMLIIVIITAIIVGAIITFIVLKKKGITIKLPKKDYGTLIKSERIK